MKPLLLIETGAPPAEITAAHGDYGQKFISVFGHPGRSVTRVSPFRGEAVPDFESFDGILVTGSPLSVCTPEPWMLPLGRHLSEHAERGGAILAVCFGLQLVSAARNAPVIRNPGGREIGTIEVELTPEGLRDPLFDGFPQKFEVHATHTDIASRVPDGATLLASNANTPVQAFRFGERAWATQFHPEFDPDLMKGIIRSRMRLITAENLDGEAILRQVHPTPWGRKLLERFDSLI